MNGKILQRIILFLVGCILTIYMITPIFKAKWIDTNFAVTAEWDGFYDEPKDSINVLYLGSSHVMAGINPLEIWKEYGITGYICGSTKLSLPATYAYLQEALKYQTPEVVVLDMSRIFQFYENQEYEEDTRRALDYLKYSETKMEAASVLMEGDSQQTKLSYRFPFFRYHSRWQELTKEDFQYLTREQHCMEKGMSMRFDRSGFDLPKDFMEAENTNERYQIDRVSAEYFEKITLLCKEKNIELLLVKIPSYNWNLKRHTLSAQLAETYGLEFIDYTMPDMRKQIQFVGKDDFVDEGDHINTYGANKVSKHLGQYLIQNYEFTKHTETDIQQEWQQDYEAYALWKENAQLKDEDNFIYYLELVNNPNYIVALSSRFDCSYKMNDAVLERMFRLGMTENLFDKYKYSYASIINGGQAVAEGLAENDEVCLKEMVDGIEVDVISQGAEAGNSAGIQFDGEECALGKTGINIAVYDKRLKQVVDVRCFNTHLKSYQIRQ